MNGNTRRVHSADTTPPDVLLHVNAPASFPTRRHLYCPTCKATTRFAVREYGWYNATVTCCECGDSWTGGERNPRPFLRNWRQDAKRRAHDTWVDAGRYTAEDRKAWFDAELRMWSWLSCASADYDIHPSLTPAQAVAP